MKLHGVWIKTAIITSAMWLTDEYAISDFRSVWRKQIELVMIIPHKDNIKKGYAIKLLDGFNINVIRSIPYPPNFNKIAARTMDPAIGASTWALGNHKCKPYRGILTIKASIYANHKAELLQIRVEKSVQYGVSNRLSDPVID